MSAISSSPHAPASGEQVASETSLVPILNRTLPGPCHAANHDSLCWGPDGLLAYACHNVVMVVDPATVQVLQCLSKHKSVVCKLSWATHLSERRLGLASADTSGVIISWDVASGEQMRAVSEGNLEIQDLAWVSGDSAHLLAVHPPNHLVMWDMASGSKIWKKSYGDTILGFDVSPFKRDTLLLRCQRSFLLTEFSVDKSPKSDGKMFYLANSSTRGASVESGASAGERGSIPVTEKRPRNKLRRMVRSMMLGEGGEEEGVRDNDSILAMFHPGVRGQVLIGYSKEVVIVDIELGQAVGQINFDRSNSSSLVTMRGCHQEPVLYLLHESGTVSVWSQRPGLSVAHTPMASMTSSASLSSLSTWASGDTAMLEISYECLSVSEHIRLAKHCRVSGLAIRPATEAELALTTTDGRLMLMALRPSSVPGTPPASPIVTLSSMSLSNVRLKVTATLSSLGQAKCVKMCPPLTTKNLNSYRPLLALGTVGGHIQVINVSSGLIEREIVVHSSSVEGLEWTSSNPAVSLLSHAHTPVTGSQGALVRNELVHVNILTGKVTQVRTEQGKEPGEARITMVRVSHLRKYFVVAFSQGPFELWDLTKMVVLRTMPRKFPHITALEWSPINSKLSKKSGSVSPVSGDTGPASSTPISERVREFVVLTDSECQLYHFTVEGQTIKDGTKIPAETGLGTITSISWKSDVIVRGCTEGNVNIWNMKTRQSKNIHTGRGAVKRMSFSPGKNNLKLLVLFETGVQIWDIKELEMINELRTPLDILKVEDIDWASSDRVILAGAEGLVRLAGLALAGTSSHSLAYGRAQPPVCPALLPKQIFRRLAAIMSHQPKQKALSLKEFKECLKTGLNGDQECLVETMLEYWGDALLEFIINENISVVKRLVAISLMLGLDFETEIWEVCRDLEEGKPLGRKFDFLTDQQTFLLRQDELSRLHTARAVMRQDKMRLTAGFICLGQPEAAVSLLMEADPDSDNFTATDQLLACLIQATANSDTSQAESIIKMVATNFVSEGKVWEGVQLLVLIGKVKDACSYLRSGGLPDQAMAVGRCLLEAGDWAELAVRHADQLIAGGQLQAGVLTLVAVGQHSQALKALLGAKMIDLAYKLLLMTQAAGITVTKELEESVLTETVKMMADLEYRQGFEMYCDKLGDKATEIKSELNIEA